MKKRAQNALQNQCCIAIIYCALVLAAIASSPAQARKEDRAALRPLLLLQDGQRHLRSKGDPAPLRQLVEKSESAWVVREAKASLAGYYAITGNWDRYKSVAEQAKPCAKLLHAIFEQPGQVSKYVDQVQDESPSDRTCYAALNAATAAGLIRDDRIWRQIRELVDARKTSKSRQLLQLLKNDKASTKTLNQAVQRATRNVSGKHPLATRVSQELLAVSAVVAAHRDPVLAGERWKQFAPHVEKDINDHVWPILGLWAALDHESQKALDYFRRAPLADHSRNALAWRARAAMRLGDWEEVRGTIASMRGEQATLSAWRYWNAHAHYRLGEKDFARSAWSRIAKEFDDYYGQLAANHVGKNLEVGRALPDANLVKRIARNADVRLAVELGASGRTIQARRVWKFLHQGVLDGNELLAAAEFAAQKGWLLGSINAANAAASTHPSHSQRFPLPLRDKILPIASRLDLDPSFIYSLIRRESRFNATAKSSAGARGLMQVMPATARAVARQHKYTRYNLSRLTLPDTNLLIGSRYVADLIKQLGDDPVLVAAAYNAGPHRVRRWLKSSKGVEKLVFVETIPFTETRLYVKAVLGAQNHYRLLLDQPKPLLTKQLSGNYS